MMNTKNTIPIMSTNIITIIMITVTTIMAIATIITGTATIITRKMLR